MYESIHLGHTFWIDDDGLFMSCPTFKDGSVEMENALSEYDWENWEEAHPHLPHPLPQLIFFIINNFCNYY